MDCLLAVRVSDIWPMHFCESLFRQIIGGISRYHILFLSSWIGCDMAIYRYLTFLLTGLRHGFAISADGIRFDSRKLRNASMLDAPRADFGI
jgi:hypothetical protein